MLLAAGLWSYPSYTPERQPVLVFDANTTVQKHVEPPVTGPLPVPTPAPVPEKPKPTPKPKAQPKPTVVAKGNQKLTVVSWNRVQCVMYAYERTGNEELLGHKVAGKIPTDTQTPQIGAVVITSEGLYGHAAVVKDIVDGQLVLDESNYINTNYKSGGPVTTGRTLPVDSPLIKGYVTQ